MFGFGGASIEVKQERVSLPNISLPTHPTAKMRKLMPALESMKDEAPDTVRLEALARSQLAEYGEDSPSFNFGSDVHCHGAGVQATSTKVYRLKTVSGARSPQNHHDRYGRWPYVTLNGSKTATVRTGDTTHKKGLGRMRGWNGWDDSKDCIEANLTSFEHNFEALLIAFGDRPSLPCTTSWRLPNLVESPEIAKREKHYNASIDVPKQFAPSASYKYNFNLPTPMAVFHVKVKAPVDSKGYVQFWDGNKKEISTTDELKFPEGSTTTHVTLRGDPMKISSGYININPSYAPNGLTVAEVTTTPPIL